MRQDDETTATQLHELLVRNGISISRVSVYKQAPKCYGAESSWGGLFEAQLTVN